MLAPLNRAQSPTSTAKANPGQRGDTPQAAQPAGDCGELAVRGQLGDGLVEAGSARHREVDGFAVGVVGGAGAGLGGADRVQPGGVPAGPRGTAVVNVTVAQQQFGEPVPSPHQIAADVLTGPDQVP